MAPEVGRAAADAGARAVGGVVRVRAARRRIAEKRGRLPQGAPLDRGAAAEAVTARGAGGRDAYQRDCDLYSGVICAISFTFCLLLVAVATTVFLFSVCKTSLPLRGRDTHTNMSTPDSLREATPSADPGGVRTPAQGERVGLRLGGGAQLCCRRGAPPRAAGDTDRPTPPAYGLAEFLHPGQQGLGRLGARSSLTAGTLCLSYTLVSRYTESLMSVSRVYGFWLYTQSHGTW